MGKVVDPAGDVGRGVWMIGVKDDEWMLSRTELSHSVSSPAGRSIPYCDRSMSISDQPTVAGHEGRSNLRVGFGRGTDDQAVRRETEEFFIAGLALVRPSASLAVKRNIGHKGGLSGETGLGEGLIDTKSHSGQAQDV